MTIQKEEEEEKEEDDKIQYGTVSIPYGIIKSKRIKTSEIIVDADKVTVRTPVNKDISDIRKLVLDKASWILKKQKEYKDRVPQIIKPSFQEGSTLPYLGKDYPIKIIKKQPKNSISFVDHQFAIRLLPTASSSSTKDYSDTITKLYHGWLMRAARPIFKNKVEETSSRLGISKPKKIGKDSKIGGAALLLLVQLT